jgi:hypothetical protein
MSEVLESPPKVNLKCKEPRLYQVSAISVSCGYGVDVGPKLCADLSSIFSIPGSGRDVQKTQSDDLQQSLLVAFRRCNCAS